MTDTLMTGTAETTEGVAASEAVVVETTTTGEQQPGAAQETTAEGAEPKADGETTSETDDAPEGAPESYEDFTLPEGVQLDAEVATNLKALAKELNLTQAQAQKVAELGAAQAQRFAAQQQSMVAEAAAAWETETRTDKEIGGDKLDENLGLARKALDQFGGEALRTLLSDSKLGNHPEVVRFMVKVGKAVSDDSIVPGNRSAANAGGDRASRLYPNQR